MKGFIGGIPVALLAVAAQAKFAERQENDFHPQAGGTAIGGPSGNDGHGHFHPQTGGTAIGGPSGNDVDGGFVSPYSANIKTDTKVNEWQKDDHSVKLKHTDVYPHPAVVPVPFGHGAQAPGMGPFGKGKRGVPGGTAMGGPSGNDEGQSFDMSVTGVFNTETEEENQDDHSTEIEHTDVHPAPVHVHPAGPAPGIFRPGTFAKRFGEPHSGGTAIGGPSGNDGGQSFSAPTNIKTDTGISEHNEDNHSIDLEHEDVYPHPHTGAFSPFRRSVNFGPPGHGAPGHFEPHPESHFEPHPESHYEPHPESHYAPHSESHYEPHQEPHYEPHPEPHYVNHQEPHVEHHPEPHYAPHYSPTYAPHYEPHKTFESELTAVKHNNNGPSAGSITFGRRGFPGPGSHFEPHPESHFAPHPESHFEPHPESHYAPHSESHYEPHSEPHYEPHPEPHYVNHQEPHVEHHPEPHYEPHYSPTYAPHNEPHTTFDHEVTSVKGNNNGPAAGGIAFGRRGFPGPGSHFEPHPESHFAPHPESHFEPHPESHYAPHSESHYEPHSEPHYEPHPEPHYVNHQEPHVEHHPEPHYAPHYSPTYAPHNEPHKTFESELTAVKNNNNGPGAGGIAFGRRAYAPTPETGATVIGGPSGNDESTGFSAPTNIGVATDVNEHNEDNHAIEGEFTDVHAPADYSREDAPACAAKVQEIVHTVTKTQYHTALETNAIPVHAPAKSVGADPYVNYPEHTEHSAGADPYANYPEHSAGSDPYANYPEHSTGSDPYAKYPEHSEHPAGADPYAPSGPDSSNHGSEGVPYVHVPMASSAVATSAVYNYPEHSAGADPYAPHKYGASQGPSYSKIAVHVPMATPASYGVFSKATPSGSMGHMIPTGVAAHKASASASASPSASHGMMFQGDAARLSGVLLDIKPLRIQPPPPISKMVQQDPHQGGTLSEMAQGTSMPNDAGKMNTIPSVPRPDQRAEHSDFDNEGIALPSTAMAADNTTDWPRSTRDVGQSGEVISGTGNSMEAGIEAKRTYMGPNHHAGHGESREIKGGKYGQSVFDRYQAE
ncbi:unnamed protein product [Penicillium nalgiovense]|nr:unnamed protein product [Penicillium nalgiovense]CAG8103104.1 unnamed protein product [Penicillium nalgiovense]CAG8126056.1 unnamed protein product [Penicillium nalgiovense]CAG8177668.1 unnamed protein product [Penicillium nalgiovense]CAG8199976.1 unnamed protein product [Penicillium nalgiovense]